MEAIQSVIAFMQNLGAACMMPIFVFIIGLIVRVPLEAAPEGICHRGLWLYRHLHGDGPAGEVHRAHLHRPCRKV